jgi:hypothetical protein
MRLHLVLCAVFQAVALDRPTACPQRMQIDLSEVSNPELKVNWTNDEIAWFAQPPGNPNLVPPGQKPPRQQDAGLNFYEGQCDPGLCDREGQCTSDGGVNPFLPDTPAGANIGFAANWNPNCPSDGVPFGLNASSWVANDYPSVSNPMGMQSSSQPYLTGVFPDGFMRVRNIAKDNDVLENPNIPDFFAAVDLLILVMETDAEYNPRGQAITEYEPPGTNPPDIAPLALDVEYNTIKKSWDEPNPKLRASQFRLNPDGLACLGYGLRPSTCASGSVVDFKTAYCVDGSQTTGRGTEFELQYVYGALLDYVETPVS